MLATAGDVFAANFWDMFDSDLGVIPTDQTGTWVEIDANTGGNSANGGTVRTGDASASVEVRTNGMSGTASSSVHIETKVNGVASSSDYTASPGTPVRVQVVASSTPTSGSVVEQVVSTTTRITASSTYTGNIQTDATPLRMKERMRASLARITKYVEKIFTWFWN